MGNAPHHLGTESKDVLKCIKSFIKTNGYPPSLREIGDCTGLKSNSTITWWLNVLVEEGKIERIPNRPRALRIKED